MMRLDKYLAESWAGQRKQVRKLIQEGNVQVNGVVQIDPSFSIIESKDRIELNGQCIKHPGKRYFMFHKPAGCITARKDDRHQTVLDYFDKSQQAGLFPVGRLDKDTEGLLLLTNDGAFDYQLMHPKHHVEKTYYFWAFGSIHEVEKQKLETGITIGEGDEVTKPAKLALDQSGYYDEFSQEIHGIEVTKDPKKYRKPVVSGYLTLTEGKKHQVKRMLRAVGCYVIYLKRISIGEVKLDERLKAGEYRELTQDEINTLLHSEL